jgi:hypothetical protein
MANSLFTSNPFTISDVQDARLNGECPEQDIVCHVFDGLNYENDGLFDYFVNGFYEVFQQDDFMHSDVLTSLNAKLKMLSFLAGSVVVFNLDFIKTCDNYYLLLSKHDGNTLYRRSFNLI